MEDGNSMEGLLRRGGGGDWSVTQAENGLGLGDDDIDLNVELKREKILCL